jgi:glycosyltransferase involved in cell wall biosynthesis/predicted metal-dependent phosphoesterase TrpH
MRIDLHVHSKHSKRPSEWILKQLGCPESFTEPLDLYRAAKEKGMSQVTVTDHNVIDGCLEIAHLPDTFISEEVTTYFPDDKCKLHVLAYDIDESIHRDIQRVRENVFELTQYLGERGIVHALAHPLYSINRKLTLAHIEKTLLLFEVFECNGARNESQNQVLKELVASLTPEVIDRLSEKHGITPRFGTPWKKVLVGGSDDHGSLTIAHRFTEVQGAQTLADFLRGIRQGCCAVQGAFSTPKTLARTMYSIAYRFYDEKFRMERRAPHENGLKLLDGFLRPERRRSAWGHSWFDIMRFGRNGFRGGAGSGANILALLRHEANRLVLEDRRVSEVALNGGDTRNLDEKWFRVVNNASNNLLARFVKHVAESLPGADIFTAFESIGSAGALYFVLAPYFIAFSSFSEERGFGGAVAKRFQLPCQTFCDPDDVSVGHFTDTLLEVNGVAGSLQNQIKAARRFKKKYFVITCRDDAPAEEDGVRYFQPIGVFDLPLYPEQKLFYPPFLEVLDYCYEMGFTHIHAATPGPLGLTALAAARILKLPIVGTYHTAIPQYAKALTGDSDMEELTRRLVLWFYDQMDAVFVPSKAFADELQGYGLNPERIRTFPRGVDSLRFHPSKRNGILDSSAIGRYGTRLLYVGRISKEKNLDLLARAFKEFVKAHADVCLVVAGDGPYRQEMEKALSGTPCLFTGYVGGEALASLYASCDLFVFPSMTDTFGNVVLEAQASGLPVIVSDCGGPRENIIPGETGLIIRGDDCRSLLDALRFLVADPHRREWMGRVARKYAEKRSFDHAFSKAWGLYSSVSSRYCA